MRLQESRTQEAIRNNEVSGKTVKIFLHSSFYELSGNWQWEMEAGAVFCSDVILSFPADFVGAKGILHPDDTAAVKELVGEQTIPFLQFRIITTYGEVKTLVGENVTVQR